jgi:hypothetical protein
MRRTWIVVIAWLMPGIACACPFCSGALELTYSQQIEDGITAIIARQESGRGARNQIGFIVLDVLKTSDDYPITPGQLVRVTAYSEGVSGGLYLIILGITGDGQLLWGPPQPITSQCRQYILQRPDRSRPRPEQLAFYANYLEHADADVAVDAWTEFAAADFEHIAPIVDRLPHARLSAIMTGTRDKTILLQSPEWLGLYGMLIGMCGNEHDAQVLREIVLAPPDSPEMPRIGIDGVMGGLMLLEGEAGLDLLVSHIAGNPSAPIDEHNALRNACTFMWTYGNERVPLARLEDVVRGYLHKPQLTALVLLDLARWKDWESIAVIAELHDDAAFADINTQEEFVQFLLAAEREATTNPIAASTPDIVQCLDLLAHYRQSNAALVQSVEASVIR